MGKNLRWQVCNALRDRLAIGESRYDGKIDGTAAEKIYSWKTYNSYKEQAVKFAVWATERGCRTLDDAHQYIDAYIISHRADGPEPWSAWSQKMAKSAIAKVYGESSTGYAACDARAKSDISRSRGQAVRDSHFSAVRNAEFVAFCTATGLRRTEIAHLRGRDYDRVSIVDGKYYLALDRDDHTKGGRTRTVEIIGPQAAAVAAKISNTAPGVCVWEHLPQCDIHDYRAQYAGAIYNSMARERHEIPPADRYVGRCANYGVVYDKQALAAVSAALGHGKPDAPRYDVVVSNYDRYFDK